MLRVGELLRPGGLLLVVLAVTSSCSGASSGVESLLSPDPPLPRFTVVVTEAGSGIAVAGSAVTWAGRSHAVDAGGRVRLAWEEAGDALVEAAGYEPVTVTVSAPGEAPVAVVLEPRVLLGEVVTPEGVPLPAATVDFGGETVVTGADGGFRFRHVEPGELSVRRPGRQGTTLSWEEGTITVVLEPRVVRALLMPGTVAVAPGPRRELLDIAEGTVIDAIVVEIKDDGGQIFVAGGSVPAEAGDLPTMAAIRNELADRSLSAVALISVFADSALAAARPDVAALDAGSGLPWQDTSGIGWLDPTDDASWRLSLELGAAACVAGFDEVMFDEVRFPPGEVRLDRAVDEAAREEVVVAFLERAVDVLHPLGCAVSVTMPGAALSSGGDGGLRPDRISGLVDVLSPIVFPSAYPPGWLGYDDPAEFPAEVVGEALDAGTAGLTGAAALRPWLQTQPYDADDVTIEINEAEERGLGWMLWGGDGRYDGLSLPTGDR